MGNKNQKQDEKSLKQMYEEINQKISETKEKREAFVTAADTINTETFFLKFCEEILRGFQKIGYFPTSEKFYFTNDFATYVPSNIYEEMGKECFIAKLQKCLDEYSPEKLKIQHCSYYSSNQKFSVKICLV